MISTGSETTDAALSGALSGSLIGGGSGLMEGYSKRAILKRALLGALGGGALAGSAIGLGHEMLGQPEDEGAYTRSGAVGGLAAGAGAGAAGGAALASGLIPSKRGLLARIAKMGYGPAMSTGAVVGAGAGAFQGSDEGMQLDYIKNEMDRHNREKLLREMGL